MINSLQVFVAKQKLMVDVGAILRSIDKSNEYEVPEVTNYLKRYREFSGNIRLQLHHFLSEAVVVKFWLIWSLKTA